MCSSVGIYPYYVCNTKYINFKLRCLIKTLMVNNISLRNVPLYCNLNYKL